MHYLLTPPTNKERRIPISVNIIPRADFVFLVWFNIILISSCKMIHVNRRMIDSSQLVMNAIDARTRSTIYQTNGRPWFLLEIKSDRWTFISVCRCILCSDGISYSFFYMKVSMAENVWTSHMHEELLGEWRTQLTLKKGQQKRTFTTVYKYLVSFLDERSTQNTFHLFNWCVRFHL